ncbi:MAG: hypothetical protein WCA11_14235 [Terracidiphilus sp.]
MLLKGAATAAPSTPKSIDAHRLILQSSFKAAIEGAGGYSSALEKSKMTGHVRETSIPREHRLPTAAWLGILWVGMFAGITGDILGFLHEISPALTTLYVHAAVFTGWMLFHTAHALLALSDQKEL